MSESLTKVLSDWWHDTWEETKVGLFAALLFCGLLLFVAVLTLPLWVGMFWESGNDLRQLYLVGVVSYWIYWLFTVVINVFRLFSIHDKNFAQIGIRRNIFTGKLEPEGENTYLKALLFGMFGIFLASLLTWCIYPIELYAFIKRKIAQWNRPKELKRIDWVLRNYALSPFDMVRFDIQTTEILLGRSYTTEEYENYERDLIARGIDVRIAGVIEANKGQLSKDQEIR